MSKRKNIVNKVVVAGVVAVGLSMSGAVHRTAEQGFEFFRKAQADLVVVQRENRQHTQLAADSCVAVKSVAAKGAGKSKCFGCPHLGGCSQCVASVGGDTQGWLSFDALPEFELNE